MAAVMSCRGAYQCGRLADMRESCLCTPDHQRSAPDVSMAPEVGIWRAIVDAAAAFCAVTTPPCNKKLLGPAETAAFTTVATTTSIVVARAVPRAVKRLAGVLVADALAVAPLTNTAAESPKWGGVQAHGAAKVAAALLALSCTVHDRDWPSAVPQRARAHVHQALRAAFDKCLNMEVLADKRLRQGKVLAITLGEAQRVAYWQYNRGSGVCVPIYASSFN